MKKLSLATTILASIFAINTHAYQTEVSTLYEYTDIDENIDVDTVGINGKYYLNSVQNKNVPLAEAGFLNKASNIGLGYIYSQQDYDINFASNELFLGSPATTVGVKEKYNIIGASAEFFIPNSQFYIAGTLNRTDLKIKATSFGISQNGSTDGTGYALEVGFLPIDGLLVAAGVSDQSESIDPIKASKDGYIRSYSNATIASGEDDDTAFTLRAKYVTQLAGFYTNFEAQSYFGDETTYSLGADLYLDPTLSVGVSFADSTADYTDTIFNVRAQKFFTQQFAVGVGYTTTDDADSYGITGTFRF